MLQKLDLAQSPLGEDFLGEDIGELLDRDSISSGGVLRRAATVSASPLNDFLLSSHSA